MPGFGDGSKAIYPSELRMRFHPKTMLNLPNWIPSNRSLIHLVALKFVPVVVCSHVGLLAYNFERRVIAILELLNASKSLFVGVA